jgi:hypothetical protein
MCDMDVWLIPLSTRVANNTKKYPADELSSSDPTQTADTTVLSRKVNRFRG